MSTKIAGFHQKEIVERLCNICKYTRCNTLVFFVNILYSFNFRKIQSSLIVWKPCVMERIEKFGKFPDNLHQNCVQRFLKSSMLFSALQFREIQRIIFRHCVFVGLDLKHGWPEAELLKAEVKSNQIKSY